MNLLTLVIVSTQLAPCSIDEPKPSFPMVSGLFSARDKVLSSIVMGVQFEEGIGPIEGEPPEGLEELQHAPLRLEDTEKDALILLRGYDEPGRRCFVVDTDRDSRVDDELLVIVPEEVDDREVYRPRWSVRLKESDGTQSSVTLELLVDGDRVEYHLDSFWKATLSWGDEALRVGVVRLSQSTHIVFADTDQDDVFEKHLDGKNRLGLGGRFWTLQPDFAAHRFHLVPSDRAPVEVGYEAPPIDEPWWNGEGRFRSQESGESPTLLVFCHPGCFGCVQVKPILESLCQDLEKKGVRFVSICRTEGEAEQDLLVGFRRVVAPAVWERYGVTPTPTLIVIDSEGVIRYRGGSAAASTLTSILTR